MSRSVVLAWRPPQEPGYLIPMSILPTSLVFCALFGGLSPGARATYFTRMAPCLSGSKPAGQRVRRS
jgi:hypothetical protein